MSGTGVPNLRTSALFSEISKYSEEKGSREVRGLGLFNETGAAVSNVYLYFNYPQGPVTLFDLDAIEGAGYFSVSGSSGENVKLTIPSVGAGAQYALLYQRISEGKVGYGDSWLVQLTDGVLAGVIVNLSVLSSSVVGTDGVVVFKAPDYTALGLVFATTTLRTGVGNYEFRSIAPTNRAKLEIAPVTLVGGQKMETINDSQSLPFTGTFYETSESVNKILLATSLANNAGLGLWFKRTIITPNPVDEVACEDLKDYMANLLKEEEITVTVDWT